jgi:hypothetical protein
MEIHVTNFSWIEYDSCFIMSEIPVAISLPLCESCGYGQFIIWNGNDIDYTKRKVAPVPFFNRAPCHGSVLGNGGIAPRILDLGTWWRWVVSFTPRPLYRQERTPWYPLDRRLGGSQYQSGRGGEEKNSQLLPGIEPPFIQPVAQRYTAELSRLLVAYVTDANFEGDNILSLVIHFQPQATK